MSLSDPVLITAYIWLAEGAKKGLVADLVRPQQRGSVFGFYNLAFGITVLPASLLMGALWSWRGPGLAFLVSAGLGGAATLLMLLLVKQSTHDSRLTSDT